MTLWWIPALTLAIPVGSFCFAALGVSFYESWQEKQKRRLAR
jgi:hypothetical protein